MALVIEDGSGVQGANSYVTLAEFKQYASLRGYVIPTSDPELEALLIRGMDYIKFNPKAYKGTKVYIHLPFPRRGVVIDGVELPSDQIPEQIKIAQMQLGIEGTFYDSLRPNRDGASVTMEKVDVLQVSYAQPVGGGALGLELTTVEDILTPFYSTTSGFLLNTRRA